jgi:hypothetical protein
MIMMTVTPDSATEAEPEALIAIEYLSSPHTLLCIWLIPMLEKLLAIIQ